jgi:hypothetical protein
MRPEKVALKEEPLTVIVWPPGDAVTVYEVIALPPSEAGGDQVIVADKFPVVAVTLRGGPGGPVNMKTSAELMGLVPRGAVTVTSTGPTA